MPCPAWVRPQGFGSRESAWAFAESAYPDMNVMAAGAAANQEGRRRPRDVIGAAKGTHGSKKTTARKKNRQIESASCALADVRAEN